VAGPLHISGIALAAVAAKAVIQYCLAELRKVERGRKKEEKKSVTPQPLTSLCAPLVPQGRLRIKDDR